MLAWYLLYSKPRRERVAFDNLLRQGYEAYLPVMRRRKRRGARYVDGLEPLFPRYLFVNLSDQSDDWSPIRSTVGVSHLVRFGDVAARVPDALVTRLRRREAEDGARERTGERLRAGDQVRIVDGVLRGYEAIFEAKTGKERVLLLLEIAGRAATVRVAARMVERALPPAATPDGYQASRGE